jgi:hypothetical protein
VHRRITRMITVASAGAALSGLGLTGASISGAAVSGFQVAAASWAASPAAAVPGAQLWVRRYNGPFKGFDAAQAVAVSPGGGKVFVTGTSQGLGAKRGGDYATVAYGAATGARLWVSRYNGPGNNGDEAASVAVSPDGGTVFVTGLSTGTNSATDYATIAYRAATGAQLWVSRYNGPGNGSDVAHSVAVSPGGNTVFVTGISEGNRSGFDYATVAYRAATGARLWVSRYTGPGKADDDAASVAVGPGGRTVFVTGGSVGKNTGRDYATVAYSAATGAQRWVKRYNGPGNGEDGAFSLVVGPGGGKVFVTGQSTGVTSGEDYATVAYSTTTGAQRWVSRYNGPGHGLDGARSVVASPGGGKLFVTGLSTGTNSAADYATIAYSASTGAQLWAQRYNGPGNSFDLARSVTVTPGGGKVFVTGQSTGVNSGEDYATVAYSAATGAQLWARRYNGPGNSTDDASSVAVSPRGGKVFVTGQSSRANPPDLSSFDYATVAYRG